ncbi:protein-glutamine glutaminase family protein [Actinophytocola oryzae]|uniref:protein-glutamine glutaminase family protein n=1 Tax=Actinophytocola oryzae TaxID=502181 RepID=UPI001AAF7802|nr:protein-glutamine glutaminase family protein [Actinophytocola oryzae]
MTVQDIATAARANGWNGRDPVELVACDTGDLAALTDAVGAELGVPIDFYAGLVWLGPGTVAGGVTGGELVWTDGRPSIVSGGRWSRRAPEDGTVSPSPVDRDTHTPATDLGLAEPVHLAPPPPRAIVPPPNPAAETLAHQARVTRPTLVDVPGLTPDFAAVRTMITNLLAQRLRRHAPPADWVRTQFPDENFGDFGDTLDGLTAQTPHFDIEVSVVGIGVPSHETASLGDRSSAHESAPDLTSAVDAAERSPARANFLTVPVGPVGDVHFEPFGVGSEMRGSQSVTSESRRSAELTADQRPTVNSQHDVQYRAVITPRHSSILRRHHSDVPVTADVVVPGLTLAWHGATAAVPTTHRRRRSSALSFDSSRNTNAVNRARDWAALDEVRKAIKHVEFPGIGRAATQLRNKLQLDEKAWEESGLGEWFDDLAAEHGGDVVTYRLARKTFQYRGRPHEVIVGRVEHPSASQRLGRPRTPSHVTSGTAEISHKRSVSGSTTRSAGSSQAWGGEFSVTFGQRIATALGFGLSVSGSYGRTAESESSHSAGVHHEQQTRSTGEVDDIPGEIHLQISVAEPDQAAAKDSFRYQFIRHPESATSFVADLPVRVVAALPGEMDSDPESGSGASTGGRGPSGMRVEEVPHNVWGQWRLTPATEQYFVDRLVRSLVVKGAVRTADIHDVEQRLREFLRDNAKALHGGDRLRFSLSGERDLFLSGTMVADQGKYVTGAPNKQLSGLLAVSESRRTSVVGKRSRSAGFSASGDAGVASLSGSAEASANRSRESSVSRNVGHENQFETEGGSHLYRYPMKLDARLGLGFDDLEPPFEWRGEKLDPASEAPAEPAYQPGLAGRVQIAVPERRGIGVDLGPASTMVETGWLPASQPTTPMREGRLPAEYEIDSLKPIDSLASTATRMLVLPAATGTRSRMVDIGKRVFLGRASAPLGGGNPGDRGRESSRMALDTWSSWPSRQARFGLAGTVSDRLWLESHNDGGIAKIGGRDLFGSVGLTTVLGNARIVDRDDAHTFPSTTRTTIELDRPEERSKGVTLTHSVSAPLGPVTGGVEATVGVRRDHSVGEKDNDEVTTTHSRVERGYLVEFDVRHQLDTSVHGSDTGPLGGEHPGAETRETRYREVPQAVKVWVTASDLPTIGELTAHDVDRNLHPDDRRAYEAVRAGTPLPAPPDATTPPTGAGHGVGGVDPGTPDTVRDLVRLIEERLRDFVSKYIPHPKTAAKYTRLNDTEMLGDLATRLALNFDIEMTDMLNGGLVALANRPVDSGKLEELVIVSARLLDDAQYRGRDREYSFRSELRTSTTKTASSSTALSGGVTGSGSKSIPIPKFFGSEMISEAVAPQAGLEGERSSGRQRETVTGPTTIYEWKGEAERHGFGIEVTVQVHPYMRSGAYRRNVPGLRTDPLTGWFTGTPFTLPEAVRTTVGSIFRATGRPLDEVDNSWRESRKLDGAEPGVPKDATIRAWPFDAPKLQEALIGLAHGLSARRAYHLLVATRASWLSQHFDGPLSAAGYTVQVGSRSISSVNVSFDLGRRVIVRQITGATLTHLSTTADETTTSVEKSGTLSASAVADPAASVLGIPGYEREFGSERATSPGGPRTTERRTDRVFLVQAELRPRLTVQHRDGTTTTPYEWHPKEAGDPPKAWLRVDEAGLAALGLPVPKPAPTITVPSASPSRPGAPRSGSAHRGRRGSLTPSARPPVSPSTLSPSLSPTLAPPQSAMAPVRPRAQTPGPARQSTAPAATAIRPARSSPGLATAGPASPAGAAAAGVAAGVPARAAATSDVFTPVRIPVGVFLRGNESDEFAAAVALLPRRPGEVGIVFRNGTHGGPRPTGPEMLDAAKSAGWNGKDAIRLYVCEPGNLASLADRLAKETGVTVFRPIDLAWIGMDGPGPAVRIGPAATTDDGRLVVPMRPSADVDATGAGWATHTPDGQPPTPSTYTTEVPPTAPARLGLSNPEHLGPDAPGPRAVDTTGRHGDALARVAGRGGDGLRTVAGPDGELVAAPWAGGAPPLFILTEVENGAFTVGGASMTPDELAQWIVDSGQVPDGDPRPGNVVFTQDLDGDPGTAEELTRALVDRLGALTGGTWPGLHQVGEHAPLVSDGTPDGPVTFATSGEPFEAHFPLGIDDVVVMAGGFVVAFPADERAWQELDAFVSDGSAGLTGTAGLEGVGDRIVVLFDGAGETARVALPSGRTVELSGREAGEILLQAALMRETLADRKRSLVVVTRGAGSAAGGLGAGVRAALRAEGFDNDVYAGHASVESGTLRLADGARVEPVLAAPGDARGQDHDVPAARGPGEGIAGDYHRVMDGVAGLTLSTVELASWAAELGELAGTGVVERRDLPAGVGDQLSVIGRGLATLTDPGAREQLRGLVNDAVLIASHVPTRPSGRTRAEWQSIQPITPDRLVQVLDDIASYLERGANPFTAPRSMVRGIDFPVDAPLPVRLAVLGLVNLSQRGRSDLLDAPLFPALLANPAALVESMYAVSGHEEQRFITTCKPTVIDVALRARVPSVAALLTIGHRAASWFEHSLQRTPPTARAVRDRPLGRTYEQVLQDRVARTRSTMDGLTARALELAASGRQDPAAWRAITDQWARSMQKLGTTDLNQPPVAVLTPRVVRGSSLGSELLAPQLHLDRPGRRKHGGTELYSASLRDELAAEPDGRPFGSADRETLHQPPVPLADRLDTARAREEFWARMASGAGDRLRMPGHVVYAQAIRVEGRPVFSVNDPGNGRRSLLTPDEFVAWARKNKVGGAPSLFGEPDTAPAGGSTTFDPRPGRPGTEPMHAVDRGGQPMALRPAVTESGRVLLSQVDSAVSVAIAPAPPGGRPASDASLDAMAAWAYERLHAVGGGRREGLLAAAEQIVVRYQGLPHSRQLVGDLTAVVALQLWERGFPAAESSARELAGRFGTFAEDGPPASKRPRLDNGADVLPPIRQVFPQFDVMLPPLRAGAGAEFDGVLPSISALLPGPHPAMPPQRPQAAEPAADDVAPTARANTIPPAPPLPELVSFEPRFDGDSLKLYLGLTSRGMPAGGLPAGVRPNLAIEGVSFARNGAGVFIDPVGREWVRAWVVAMGRKVDWSKKRYYASSKVAELSGDLVSQRQVSTWWNEAGLTTDVRAAFTVPMRPLPAAVRDFRLRFDGDSLKLFLSDDPLPEGLPEDTQKNYGTPPGMSFAQSARGVFVDPEAKHWVRTWAQGLVAAGRDGERVARSTGFVSKSVVNQWASEAPPTVSGTSSSRSSSPAMRSEASEFGDGGVATPPSVLDDETWRHSDASTAEWFAPADEPLRPADWEGLRAGAEVRTVDTELADPLLTGTARPGRLPRLRHLIRYDVRRMEVTPGRFVREYTVRLRLDGSRVSATDRVAVELDVKAGLDAMVNRGFRLPDGDQLHMRVDFVGRGEPAHADITLLPADDPRRTDQTRWSLRDPGRRLAHEIPHFAGLVDEYVQGTRVFLANENRGRVVDDDGPMGRLISSASTIKPRHAWAIERTMVSQLGDVRGWHPVAAPTALPDLTGNDRAGSASDDFVPVSDVPYAQRLATLLEGGDTPVDFREVLTILRQSNARRDGEQLRDAYEQSQGHSLADALTAAQEAGRLTETQVDRVNEETGHIPPRSLDGADFPPPPRTGGLPGTRPADTVAVQSFADVLRDWMDAGAERDALELLRTLDREPRRVWAVEDAYRLLTTDQHGVGRSLGEDLAAALPGEREYVEHLFAQPIPDEGVRQEWTDPSPVEWDAALEWFQAVSRMTFDYRFGQVPVPHGFASDHCYMRAHLVALKLIQLGTQPRKIFIGSNEPPLSTSWNLPDTTRIDLPFAYHVASMVFVQREGGPEWMVFDPTLSDRPLTEDEWIGMLGSSPVRQRIVGPIDSVLDALRIVSAVPGAVRDGVLREKTVVVTSPRALELTTTNLLPRGPGQPALAAGVGSVRTLDEQYGRQVDAGLAHDSAVLWLQEVGGEIFRLISGFLDGLRREALPLVERDVVELVREAVAVSVGIERVGDMLEYSPTLEALLRDTLPNRFADLGREDLSDASSDDSDFVGLPPTTDGSAPGGEVPLASLTAWVGGAVARLTGGWVTEVDPALVQQIHVSLGENAAHHDVAGLVDVIARTALPHAAAAVGYSWSTGLSFARDAQAGLADPVTQRWLVGKFGRFDTEGRMFTASRLAELIGLPGVVSAADVSRWWTEVGVSPDLQERFEAAAALTHDFLSWQPRQPGEKLDQLFPSDTTRSRRSLWTTSWLVVQALRTDATTGEPLLTAEIGRYLGLNENTVSKRLSALGLGVAVRRRIAGSMRTPHPDFLAYRPSPEHPTVESFASSRNFGIDLTRDINGHVVDPEARYWVTSWQQAANVAGPPTRRVDKRPRPTGPPAPPVSTSSAPPGRPSFGDVVSAAVRLSGARVTALDPVMIEEASATLWEVTQGLVRGAAAELIASTILADLGVPVVRQGGGPAGGAPARFADTRFWAAVSTWVGSVRDGAVSVPEAWLWPPARDAAAWVAESARLSEGRLAGVEPAVRAELLADAASIVTRQHRTPLVIEGRGGVGAAWLRPLIDDVETLVAHQLLDSGPFAAAALSSRLADALGTRRPADASAAEPLDVTGQRQQAGESSVPTGPPLDPRRIEQEAADARDRVAVALGQARMAQRHTATELELLARSVREAYGAVVGTGEALELASQRFEDAEKYWSALREPDKFGKEAGTDLDAADAVVEATGADLIAAQSSYTAARTAYDRAVEAESRATRALATATAATEQIAAHLATANTATAAVAGAGTRAGEHRDTVLAAENAANLRRDEARSAVDTAKQAREDAKEAARQGGIERGLAQLSVLPPGAEVRIETLGPLDALAAAVADLTGLPEDSVAAQLAGLGPEGLAQAVNSGSLQVTTPNGPVDIAVTADLHRPADTTTAPPHGRPTASARATSREVSVPRASTTSSSLPLRIPLLFVTPLDALSLLGRPMVFAGGMTRRTQRFESATVSGARTTTYRSIVPATMVLTASRPGLEPLVAPVEAGLRLPGITRTGVAMPNPVPVEAFPLLRSGVVTVPPSFEPTLGRSEPVTSALRTVLLTHDENPVRVTVDGEATTITPTAQPSITLFGTTEVEHAHFAGHGSAWSTARGSDASFGAGFFAGTKRWFAGLFSDFGSWATEAATLATERSTGHGFWDTELVYRVERPARLGGATGVHDTVRSTVTLTVADARRLGLPLPAHLTGSQDVNPNNPKVYWFGKDAIRSVDTNKVVPVLSYGLGRAGAAAVAAKFGTPDSARDAMYNAIHGTEAVTWQEGGRTHHLEFHAELSAPATTVPSSLTEMGAEDRAADQFRRTLDPRRGARAGAGGANVVTGTDNPNANPYRGGPSTSGGAPRAAVTGTWESGHVNKSGYTGKDGRSSKSYGGLRDFSGTVEFTLGHRSTPTPNWAQRFFLGGRQLFGAKAKDRLHGPSAADIDRVLAGEPAGQQGLRTATVSGAVEVSTTADKLRWATQPLPDSAMTAGIYLGTPPPAPEAVGRGAFGDYANVEHVWVTPNTTEGLYIALAKRVEAAEGSQAAPGPSTRVPPKGSGSWSSWGQDRLVETRTVDARTTTNVYDYKHSELTRPGTTSADAVRNFVGQAGSRGTASQGISGRGSRSGRMLAPGRLTDFNGELTARVDYSAPRLLDVSPDSSLKRTQLGEHVTGTTKATAVGVEGEVSLGYSSRREGAVGSAVRAVFGGGWRGGRNKTADLTSGAKQAFKYRGPTALVVLDARYTYEADLNLRNVVKTLPFAPLPVTVDQPNGVLVELPVQHAIALFTSAGVPVPADLAGALPDPVTPVADPARTLLPEDGGYASFGDTTVVDATLRSPLTEVGNALTTLGVTSNKWRAEVLNQVDEMLNGPNGHVWLKDVLVGDQGHGGVISVPDPGVLLQDVVDIRVTARPADREPPEPPVPPVIPVKQSNDNYVTVSTQDRKNTTWSAAVAVEAGVHGRKDTAPSKEPDQDGGPGQPRATPGTWSLGATPQIFGGARSRRTDVILPGGGTEKVSTHVDTDKVGRTGHEVDYELTITRRRAPMPMLDTPLLGVPRHVDLDRTAVPPVILAGAVVLQSPSASASPPLTGPETPPTVTVLTTRPPRNQPMFEETGGWRVESIGASTASAVHDAVYAQLSSQRLPTGPIGQDQLRAAAGTPSEYTRPGGNAEYVAHAMTKGSSLHAASNAVFTGDRYSSANVVGAKHTLYDSLFDLTVTADFDPGSFRLVRALPEGTEMNLSHELEDVRPEGTVTTSASSFGPSVPFFVGETVGAHGPGPTSITSGPPAGETIGNDAATGVVTKPDTGGSGAHGVDYTGRSYLFLANADFYTEVTRHGSNWTQSAAASVRGALGGPDPHSVVRIGSRDDLLVRVWEQEALDRGLITEADVAAHAEERPPAVPAATKRADLADTANQPIPLRDLAVWVDGAAAKLSGGAVRSVDRAAVERVHTALGADAARLGTVELADLIAHSVLSRADVPIARPGLPGGAPNGPRPGRAAPDESGDPGPSTGRPRYSAPPEHLDEPPLPTDPDEPMPLPALDPTSVALRDLSRWRPGAPDDTWIRYASGDFAAPDRMSFARDANGVLLDADATEAVRSWVVGAFGAMDEDRGLYTAATVAALVGLPAMVGAETVSQWWSEAGIPATVQQAFSEAAEIPFEYLSFDGRFEGDSLATYLGLTNHQVPPGVAPNIAPPPGADFGRVRFNDGLAGRLVTSWAIVKGVQYDRTRKRLHHGGSVARLSGLVTTKAVSTWWRRSGLTLQVRELLAGPYPVREAPGEFLAFRPRGEGDTLEFFVSPRDERNVATLTNLVVPGDLGFARDSAGDLSDPEALHWVRSWVIAAAAADGYDAATLARMTGMVREPTVHQWLIEAGLASDADSVEFGRRVIQHAAAAVGELRDYEPRFEGDSLRVYLGLSDRPLPAGVPRNVAVPAGMSFARDNHGHFVDSSAEQLVRSLATLYSVRFNKATKRLYSSSDVAAAIGFASNPTVLKWWRQSGLTQRVRELVAGPYPVREAPEEFLAFRPRGDGDTLMFYVSPRDERNAASWTNLELPADISFARDAKGDFKDPEGLHWVRSWALRRVAEGESHRSVARMAGTFPSDVPQRGGLTATLVGTWARAERGRPVTHPSSDGPVTAVEPDSVMDAGPAMEPAAAVPPSEDVRSVLDGGGRPTFFSLDYGDGFTRTLHGLTSAGDLATKNVIQARRDAEGNITATLEPAPWELVRSEGQAPPVFVFLTTHGGRLVRREGGAWRPMMPEDVASMLVTSMEQRGGLRDGDVRGQLVVLTRNTGSDAPGIAAARARTAEVVEFMGAMTGGPWPGFHLVTNRPHVASLGVVDDGLTGTVTAVWDDRFVEHGELTVEDVAVLASGLVVTFPTSTPMQRELDLFVDSGAEGLAGSAGLAGVVRPVVLVFDARAGEFVRVASVPRGLVTELRGGKAGEMLLRSGVFRRLLGGGERDVVVLAQDAGARPSHGGVGFDLAAALREAGFHNNVYALVSDALISDGRLAPGARFQLVSTPRSAEVE